ncbi:MAG: tetratricopeptide repeat protein [Pirellulaceae bacterium]|nr:tetratricopeptide repeat protein [Pirellulaceae bacterium]
MPTIRETLELAIDLQNRGQVPQAAACYEAILRVDPSQPDALHLMGLVASQGKRFRQAEHYIRRAISVAPDCALFYGNLGVVLRQSGKLEEAIEAYRTSIEIDSTLADPHYNLGRAYKLKGDFVSAESSFRTSLALEPHNQSAVLSLMGLLVAEDRLSEAIEVGQSGLEHCPNPFRLHVQLALIFQKLNCIDDAIDQYKRALSLEPQHVHTLCRLATLLLAKNLLTECDYYLNRAHALEPTNQYVLCTLGQRQSAIGQSQSAIDYLRTAQALYPNFGAVSIYLGEAHSKAGRFTEALASFDHACQSESIRAEALAHKAAALMNLGRLDEAEQNYRQAIELRPGFHQAHTNLLLCRHYCPQASASDLLGEHIDWNDRYARGIAERFDFDVQPLVNRPLRLGFVSADLGQHPVGYFLVRVLEELQSADVESYIYSDRVRDDRITTRCRAVATCWRDGVGLGDQALTDRIRQDQIDILFDLAGHTAGNRLMVFARRAAPVQITWAGYVGTTGLGNMDYLLADPYHVPSGTESDYREEILRLPQSYVLYDPPTDAPPVNELPALKHGVLTFGAACNPAKVNSQVLALWRQVLDHVPGSRLSLCYSGWLDQSNQLRVREALGLEAGADRVIFYSPAHTGDVLQWYQSIDIALDTFPYSGGLTTCEAMWMGVPTVTCPGDRFASRHAYAHLSNVGLTNGIARSQAEYVQKAVALASDLPQLQQLRQSLRAKLSSSPLFQGQEFAQNFVELMRRVYERHLVGQRHIGSAAGR